MILKKKISTWLNKFKPGVKFYFEDKKEFGCICASNKIIFDRCWKTWDIKVTVVKNNHESDYVTTTAIYSYNLLRRWEKKPQDLIKFYK